MTVTITLEAENFEALQDLINILEYNDFEIIQERKEACELVKGNVLIVIEKGA